MISKIINIIKNHFVIKKISFIEVPVFENQLLLNKIALIIGGSGGIGSSIAKRFVQSGCKVVITGTQEEKMQSICKELGDSESKYVIANVKNIADIQNTVNKTVEYYGQIDILVYSAGIHCKDLFGEVSEATWNDVFDINLKGMYFACQIVSKYMINNNIHGHILTVGSASCVKPGWTPYEISKWGVKGMTLGIADKLIKHGIVVNSIAPGPVSTTMLKKDDNNDLYWPGNPSGRMCTPSEIANLATFLASNMADMVVGDTFFISGGSGTVCIDK